MRAAVLAAAVILLTPAVPTGAQTAGPSAIEGAWTLNRELSDPPPTRGGRDEGRGRQGSAPGGRGGRGGMRGGGTGRGPSGGGASATATAEERARLRDALNALLDPPDHLVVTVTQTMAVLTGGDGRTARLALDGSKVKDENTGVDRRTKRVGASLVTEINGLGTGTITQTLAVDPESKRLRVTLRMEDDRRGGPPRTITHLYDRDGS